MDGIDLKLLKIFNSITFDGEAVKYINYLFKSKVLSSLEEIFLNRILENLELKSNMEIKDTFESLVQDEYDEEIFKDVYEYDVDLSEKIDELIRKRRETAEKEILKTSLKELRYKKVSKTAINHFFDRYSDIINIKYDNNYDILDDIDDKKIYISTGIKELDEITLGIDNGTITTILGRFNNYKSMWALNIAYKALSEGKNVLYITPSEYRNTIYKRFIMRHSCDANRFKEKFRFEGPHTKYDKENCKKIKADFEMDFSDHLIIFDQSKFVISTHYNLQKLITYAEKLFKKKLGDGIDLIVIDDFTTMQLDDGRKSITNQKVIIQEYYKYLRSQTRNFLGLNRKVCVLITLAQEYINDLRMQVDFPRELKVLSDNIFEIDDELPEDLSYVDNSKNKFSVRVLQNSNGISLKFEKNEESDYDYWHIKYSPDEVPLIEQVNRLQEENRIKTEELDYSKEVINSLNEANNTSLEEQLDETIEKSEENNQEEDSKLLEGFDLNFE